MAEFDDITPTSPLWPSKPAHKPGPRRRSPGKNREEDESATKRKKRQGDDKEEPHIDEYA